MRGLLFTHVIFNDTDHRFLRIRTAGVSSGAADQIPLPRRT
uniref:Uncharacterized protein n=1 Tax=Anguilla anguilla TaxID=7936 RepID=A0A0E9R1E0_ANGAN